MDADRLVQKALELLRREEYDQAKALLKKAAVLAPLRTDIRELLEHAMSREPLRAAASLPSGGSPAGAAPAQTLRWAWLVLVGFFFLALLVVLCYIGYQLGKAPGAPPAGGAARTASTSGGGPAVLPSATPSAPAGDKLAETRKAAADLAGQGRYPEAVRSLEAAVQADPLLQQKLAADLMLYLVESGKAERSADPARAAAAFERALALDPANQEALFQLGQTLMLKGRKGTGSEKKTALEGAEAALLKALDLKPDDLRCYTALQLTYTAQGEKIKAVECIKKIMRIAPDSPEAIRAGQTLEDMGMR